MPLSAGSTGGGGVKIKVGSITDVAVSPRRGKGESTSDGACSHY